MTTSNVDDFLEHFGVKGMKWGVTKRSGSATGAYDKATEKRKVRKESKERLQERTKSVRSYRKEQKGGITQEQYDKMSTGKEYLERGTTMRRIVKNPDVVLKGQTYVSHLLEDATVYRATLPAIGEGLTIKGGRDKYRTNYEVELKTVKRLSGPSEKERLDIFIDLIDRKDVRVPGKEGTTTGRELLKTLGYGKEMDSLSKQDAGFKAYQKFNKYAGDKNSDLNSVYFNEVSSRGYNMLSDDNDKVFFSKSPVILLTPENTVKVDSVRKLSSDDINKAQRELNLVER